jgi:hypothetical protein
MRLVFFAVVVAACSTSAKHAEPRLEPVIGTRDEDDGLLTPTTEIDEDFTRYIGCDLKYADVPDGTRIDLVWLFRAATEPAPAQVLHRASYWIYDSDRRTAKRAWVDRVVDQETHKSSLGTYECVWTVSGEGGRGASATLTVKPSQKLAREDDARSARPRSVSGS